MATTHLLNFDQISLPIRPPTLYTAEDTLRRVIAELFLYKKLNKFCHGDRCRFLQRVPMESLTIERLTDARRMPLLFVS